MPTELIKRTELFQNTEIEILDMNGETWLRGNQIGLALELANPDIAVNKIYRRHRDEFDESMTQVITLPTAGGEQQVRIFSRTGAYLLAMLCKTKMGKIFRKWLLALAVDHDNQTRTGAEGGAVRPSVNDAAHAPDFDHRLDDCPLCRPEQWLTTGQLAKRWGISMRTVQGMISDGRLEAVDVFGRKLVAFYLVRALERGYRKALAPREGQSHGWRGIATDGFPFLKGGVQ